MCLCLCVCLAAGVDSKFVRVYACMRVCVRTCIVYVISLHTCSEWFLHSHTYRIVSTSDLWGYFLAPVFGLAACVDSSLIVNHLASYKRYVCCHADASLG